MVFKFDSEISDKFRDKLMEMCEALRGQSRERQAIAETAGTDFTGNYAACYGTAMRWDNQDRVKVQDALEEVARQVDAAKPIAEAEKKRREAQEAWDNRQEGEDVPKPEGEEAKPPRIEVSVYIRDHVREAHGLHSSKSSARPERLREAVVRTRIVNGQVANTRGGAGVLESELRRLWGEYQDFCAWVGLDSDSVRDAPARYIEESSQDADWMENLADIFEKAGGGEPGGVRSATNIALNLAGGLLADINTANTIILNKNSTPEEIRDVVQAMEGRLGALSDDAKRRAAEVVGADVTGCEVDQTTVDILEILKDDPAFAQKLFAVVTPEQMADAIAKLSADGAHVYGIGNDLQINAEKLDLYRQFLTFAGQTLATHTKATGEYAPVENLSDVWGAALTDDEHPERAVALSLLMREGGEVASFDPAFLASVTDQVYNWELGKKPRGAKAWNTIALDTGIWDPDKPADAGYPEGFDSWDVLANQFAAMANTPVASEKFFEDPDVVLVNGRSVNEKLKYLLIDRDWPNDDGNSFGNALDAATTHSRGPVAEGAQPPTPESRATTLLAQTFFLIDEIAPEDPGAEGWHIPLGMTDSVGMMFASYAADFVGTYDPADSARGQWIQEPTAGNPWPVSLSADSYLDVLRELGRNPDKTGLGYAYAGVMLDYENMINKAFVEAAPDTPVGSIISSVDVRSKYVGNALADVLGYGYAGGAGKEAEDQAIKEAEAKAFSHVAGFIPIGGTPIAAGIKGIVVDQVESSYDVHTNPVAEGYLKNKTKATHGWINNVVEDAMIRNGYTSVTAASQEQIPPGTLPSEAVIWQNGKPVGVKPQFRDDTNLTDDQAKTPEGQMEERVQSARQ